ncbi:MAG: gamma carbonic anhydrase family protein [Deltaproteobacteria bacterium]|nr:MAG: gamma carbonic anhydrase family protein [Deltaproteobacteria bacterium]
MILDYKGIKPKIGKNVFIAPTAVVIGKVQIMDNASIWYGAVVRGDREPITIGKNSNVQDNCTVHTDPGYPVVIGRNVTIAHNAIVHGCTIEELSLIGIGAILLNGALIKKGSVVGSGAVVREGQEVGPYQLVAGVPAALKKELDDTILEKNLESARNYMKRAAEHSNGKSV